MINFNIKIGDQIRIVKTFNNRRNQPTTLLGKICRVVEIHPDYMVVKNGSGKQYRVPYGAAQLHVAQKYEYMPDSINYGMKRDAEKAMVRQMGAAAERICAGTTSGPYTGDELSRTTDRPDAHDHRRYPSRMGDWLIYLDGRKVPFPTETVY